jgi:SPOR domain
MATPINGPVTNDIWHLSIDDLLEPVVDSPRLGGPGPFVINLSASSAPLSPPGRGLTTVAGVHVYQIQRMEDRRPRYRLRLGPFATEEQAEATLAMVRDVYPSALTATAETDDLRAIAALKPKPEGAAPAAAPPVSAPARVAAAPVNAPAPVVAMHAAAPPVVVLQPSVPRPRPLPPAASIPVLSDSVEVVRRAPPPAAKSPSAARATVPPAAAVNLSAKAPMAAAAKAAPPIAQPAATPAATPAAAPATKVAPPARGAGLPDAPRPSVESTQTLRALTPSELEDAGARWYVIQLSLSGESFDPDSLPNLDIFNEYRLYSVAGIDQGRIVHALRLGFFAEEGAAAAVASYLGAFYEKPTVKRISVAERERFRDQRVEARKDIGATGRHAVIEITGERHVRDNRPRIATVTPLAPAAAGSARISRN